MDHCGRVHVHPKPKPFRTRVGHDNPKPPESEMSQDGLAQCRLDKSRYTVLLKFTLYTNLHFSLLYLLLVQVFPRGSDMVPDVSRAVLNLRNSKDMFDIENKWFGAGARCPDSLETHLTDKKLFLEDFRGPFLLAGGTYFCLGNSHISTCFFFVNTILGL